MSAAVSVDVVTAVGTVVAAAVSLFAMAAAFKSASSAKAAVDHARDLERGAAERELARVANNVIALSLRVDDLGDRLKDAYQSLFAFANRGQEAARPYVTDIDAKKRAAGEMQEAARALLDAHANWSKRTRDELASALIKMDGNVVQLDRVREKFARELDSVEADNRIYRQRALDR